MGDIFKQDEQFKSYLKELYDGKIKNARTEAEKAKLTAEYDEKLLCYIAKTVPILVEFKELNSSYINKDSGSAGIDAFYAPRINSFKEAIMENFYDIRKKELTEKFYLAQGFSTYKDSCFHCPICNKYPVLEEGVYICPECNSIIAESFVFTRKTTDSSINSLSKTRYKRSSRLKEVVAKYSRVSAVCITYSQIISRIEYILTKENMPKTKKNILKVIDDESIDDDQFEHRIIVNTIMRNLKTYMTEEDISEIMNIFDLTNEVYHIACKMSDSTRINFFSYNFFIGRALSLIGKYHDYKHLIPSLRERDNLFAQSKIWKIVCKLRKWNYPSDF